MTNADPGLLAAFVRACLDEDTGVACAASPGPWRLNGEADTVLACDGILAAEAFALSGNQLRATAAHIVRHDPARALRGADGKRRILDLHALVHRDIGWLGEDGEELGAEIAVCGHCVPRHSHFARREDVPEGPCLTVRLLALEFTDRLEYRQEWRP